MVTEPIRDKRKLKALADYWLEQGHFRNYTLVISGVYTALRISDLLQLQWEDVYDFEAKHFRTHFTISEQKTGKQKTIALNKQVIEALKLCFRERKSSYIFAGSRDTSRPISRVQAWRIIKTATESAKISGCIACHSLRKTFGYFAWKSGVTPVILMDIYNHSSFEITRRYLGITQDDRDKVYLKMELFSTQSENNTCPEKQSKKS